MSKKAKFRLLDIETKEVSLVDVPANKRSFLVVKNAGSIGIYIDKTGSAIDVIDVSDGSSVATFGSDCISSAISYVVEQTGAGFVVQKDSESEFNVLNVGADKIVDAFDSIEDALKRAAVLEMAEQKLKDGLPKEAYAYVGDENVTSTWKLKLFESADDIPDSPSVSLTAMAAQALSPQGFRGNKVDIPSSDLDKVKKIVAQAWMKARRSDGQEVTDSDLPNSLKAEDGIVKNNILDVAKSAIVELSNHIDGRESGDVVAFCKAVRSIQSSLLGASGDVMAPVIKYDLGNAGFETKLENESANKILKEAVCRIDRCIKSIEECEVLDPEQEASIRGIAHLLNKALAGIENDIVNVAIDENDVDIADVDKAISDLMCIRVGAIINDRDNDSGTVKKAVSDVVRAAVGDNHSFDGVNKQALDLVAVKKMFQARWSSDGAVVVSVNPDEIVAEFDTYDEAEFDALRRNVNLINDVSKAMRFMAKEQDGKYVVVDSKENDKVVWEGASQEEAQAKAKELNMADMADGPEEQAEDMQSGQDQQAQKAGAAMQQDRLNRLKSIVKQYKEALDDLLGGSKSLDKFQKVGAALQQIVKELTDAKKSVNESMGIDEKRDLDGAPNAGSGVQVSDEDITDAASGVAGEGAPSIESLMKQIEELKKANAEHSDVAKSLRKEVAALKKTRYAPTTVPDDRSYVEKSFEEVSWPLDMTESTN